MDPLPFLAARIASIDLPACCSLPHFHEKNKVVRPHPTLSLQQPCACHRSFRLYCIIMAEEQPARRRRCTIKQQNSLPQYSPLARLPTELKLMILRHVHVATVIALLTVNRLFWGLRGSLQPQFIAAAQWLSSGMVPERSIRIFKGDRPDDIRDCRNGQCLVFQSNGQSHQSYWTNVRLQEEFWGDTKGNRAEPTMSVRVWPRQQSRPYFPSVPELREPRVFGRGSLCLGYEKSESESWNLVVRQISNWRLVGKRSSFQGQPCIIDHDSDLVILHSNDGEIHVWNPFHAEPWKLEHEGATIFERPRILPNRIGFVTTSRKSTKDISKDIRVVVCRSVFWQDTKKSPDMKLTSFLFPLFSYFPGIETGSDDYESLHSLAVIKDVSRNSILFQSPRIGRIAITYTGKVLPESTPHKQEKIVGEFSDGARVIYFESRTRKPSYVRIMKDDQVRLRLDHKNRFGGFLLFQDTYLVIVDKDNEYGVPHCRLRIFARAGELVYDFQLGGKYSTFQPRIFEEGHSIVLYANDLSEATVWNFEKPFQSHRWLDCAETRTNPNPT